MGIRGLTGRVQHYKTLHHGEFLEGGDFHVDLCNFTRAGCEKFRAQGFLAVFQDNVDKLEKFKPHSLTMYFDSWFPRDKIPTKMERQSKRLAEITWDDGLLVNDLAHEELSDMYPDIKIIITGREAEDEIFDTLDKKREFTRKQFIFSSDSDCFTFDLARSDMVYIVPLYNTKIWPHLAEMYKLSTLVSSWEVQPYVRRSMPASIGTSIVASKTVTRRSQEIINMHDEAANSSIVFLACIPTDAADPYLEGTPWREATYGAILGEGVEVVEYRQVNRHTETFSIKSSTSRKDELEDELLENGLVDVLVETLTKSQKGGHYELKTETKAIRAYLESLKKSKEYNIHSTVPTSTRLSTSYDSYLHRKCQSWCCVLLATFMSILHFVYCHELDVPLYRLGWKLNPKDMYMHLTRATASR